MMERVWIIVAGLGVLVAAVFLWQGNVTVTFVAATLGVVAWFLSLRDRLQKTILPASEEEDDAEEEQHANGDGDEN
jgi:type IV secretory pathway VirB3-like protein